MMQLAQILYHRGFYITFVNTQYVQDRISRSGSVESVKSPPDFRFETFPDGLPPEHGRTSKLAELCRSFTDNGPLYFDKLMDKLKQSQPDGVPPVTCIVSDGLVSFPQKIARKLGVPRVSFWTHSACGFSTYFFAPLLVEKGYIPLEGISTITPIVFALHSFQVPTPYTFLISNTTCLLALYGMVCYCIVMQMRGV
jgi:hypothetical protein